MKQFIIDLFGESSAVSMMRVMSFICCVSACYLAFTKPDATVIGLLLGAAFGGKVAQKAAE